MPSAALGGGSLPLPWSLPLPPQVSALSRLPPRTPSRIALDGLRRLGRRRTPHVSRALVGMSVLVWKIALDFVTGGGGACPCLCPRGHGSRPTMRSCTVESLNAHSVPEPRPSRHAGAICPTLRRCRCFGSEAVSLKPRLLAVISSREPRQV